MPGDKPLVTAAAEPRAEKPKRERKVKAAAARPIALRPVDCTLLQESYDHVCRRYDEVAAGIARRIDRRSIETAYNRYTSAVRGAEHLRLDIRERYSDETARQFAKPFSVASPADIRDGKNNACPELARLVKIFCS